MTDDEIFAGLDTLPWAEVEDNWGPAVKVPALLRGLRSSSEQERWDAWDEIGQSIYNLGARFPATRLAVPFLARTASAPDTPDRQLVLGFMAELAIGQDFDHFPSGYDEDLFHRRLAELQAHSAESWEEYLDQYVASARDERRRASRERHREFVTLAGAICDVESCVTAYEAVATEIPGLRHLLGDEDAAVRAATAYLLAWFPRQAGASVPMLIDLLADERVDEVSGNALVALGLLSKDSVPVLTRYLDGENVLLSWMAALALTASGALTETVIERLGDALRSGQKWDGFLFLWGEFPRSASQCLSAITGEFGPLALDRATQAVAASSSFRSHRPAQAALALAFPEPLHPGTVVADLGGDQQYLLRVIADLDDGAWSGNGLEILFRPKNLPHRQADLRTFISPPS